MRVGERLIHTPKAAKRGAAVAVQNLRGLDANCRGQLFHSKLVILSLDCGGAGLQELCNTFPTDSSTTVSPALLGCKQRHQQRPIHPLAQTATATARASTSSGCGSWNQLEQRRPLRRRFCGPAIVTDSNSSDLVRACPRSSRDHHAATVDRCDDVSRVEHSHVAAVWVVGPGHCLPAQGAESRSAVSRLRRRRRVVCTQHQANHVGGRPVDAPREHGVVDGAAPKCFYGLSKPPPARLPPRQQPLAYMGALHFKGDVRATEARHRRRGPFAASELADPTQLDDVLLKEPPRIVAGCGTVSRIAPGAPQCFVEGFHQHLHHQGGVGIYALHDASSVGLTGGQARERPR